MEEKRQVEMEFVAIRKNYMKMTVQITEQEQRVKDLNIEVINLVNENKSLNGELNDLSKKYQELNLEKKGV